MFEDTGLAEGVVYSILVTHDWYRLACKFVLGCDLLSKKLRRKVVLVDEVEEHELRQMILDYIWSEKRRSQMDEQWFQDFLMGLHSDLSEILDVPIYFKRKQGKMRRFRFDWKNRLKNTESL